MESRIVEFGVLILRGEKVSGELIENLMMEIRDNREKFAGKPDVPNSLASILFDFAMEPSNKYGRYSESEFRAILNVWENAVEEIGEIFYT